jgi:hypothetical protein
VAQPGSKDWRKPSGHWVQRACRRRNTLALPLDQQRKQLSLSTRGTRSFRSAEGSAFGFASLLNEPHVSHPISQVCQNWTRKGRVKAGQELHAESPQSSRTGCYASEGTPYSAVTQLQAIAVTTRIPEPKSPR